MTTPKLATQSHSFMAGSLFGAVLVAQTRVTFFFYGTQQFAPRMFIIDRHSDGEAVRSDDIRIRARREPVVKKMDVIMQRQLATPSDWGSLALCNIDRLSVFYSCQIKC